MELKYILENGQEYRVRWINDIKLSKNQNDEFYLQSCTLYQNVNNLDNFSRIFGNVNLLTNQSIVGTHISNNDNKINIIQQNGDRPQKVFIIDIENEDLKVVSRQLFTHLGYKTSDSFRVDKDEVYAELGKLLNLPDESFGYSYAHKIKYNKNDELDYIIIPSFEILRYFFLKGSKLTKELFEYFIRERELESQNIESIYIHTSDKPSTFRIDEDGKRIANLAVKNGFHDLELRCIIDIAFIKNAFECIELIRESLLSDTHNEKPFGKVKTKIPKDLPFQMCVGGQTFEWKSEKYLLVNQIFSANDTKPYDLIEILTFSDYHKGVKGNYSLNEANEIGNRLQTKPTNNGRLTDDFLGNGAQPGIAEVITNIPEGFAQQDVPIKRIAKEEQLRKYGLSTIEVIEQEINSINEGIGNEGKGGRVRTKNINKTKEQHGIRRDSFVESLKNLIKYEVSFFQIDKNPSSYIGFQNNDKLVISKGKDKYNIVFCQINNKNNSFCYIIRADDDESDTVRYGFYCSPQLTQIEPNYAWYLVTNLFRKKGIYLKKGVLKDFKKHLDLNPDFKNQGEKTAIDLLVKIEGEIEDFFSEKEQLHIK